jgi:hypothetical protein
LSWAKHHSIQISFCKISNYFLIHFERYGNLLCMTVHKIAGGATEMFSVAL